MITVLTIGIIICFGYILLLNITRCIYFVVKRKKADEVAEARNKKINKILK